MFGIWDSKEKQRIVPPLQVSGRGRCGAAGRQSVALTLRCMWRGSRSARKGSSSFCWGEKVQEGPWDELALELCLQKNEMIITGIRTCHLVTGISQGRECCNIFGWGWVATVAEAQGRCPSRLGGRSMARGDWKGLFAQESFLAQGSLLAWEIQIGHIQINQSPCLLYYPAP